MQGACAPESDKGKLTWIVSLFNRHQPQCAKHVLIYDINNALRGFNKPNAERIRDRLHCLFCSLAIEWHFSAKQAARDAACGVSAA